MSNLFVNPFFCDGAHERAHPQYGNIFLPDAWQLGWLDRQPFDGIQAGLVAHRPEATFINIWMGLEPELFGPTSWVWKIFVRNPLYTWFEPAAPLELPAGAYRIKLRVWPKIHHTSGAYMTDPWSAEVGLALGGGNIAWRNQENGGLLFTQYTWQTWEFMHGGGVLAPRFYLKGKYPVDNTFFVDEVWLEAAGDAGTPEPPSVPPVAGDLLAEVAGIGATLRELTALVRGYTQR